MARDDELTVPTGTRYGVEISTALGDHTPQNDEPLEIVSGGSIPPFSGMEMRHSENQIDYLTTSQGAQAKQPSTKNFSGLCGKHGPSSPRQSAAVKRTKACTIQDSYRDQEEVHKSDELEKLVAVMGQQLRLKDQEIRIWKNLSAIKDRQMRDGDDQAKKNQRDLKYKLEYLKGELVKVKPPQLDENKEPIADTASDDGSDGIFVHRSKGELEMKIDELETQVEKLTAEKRDLERENVGKDGRIEEIQRERDHYDSEVLQCEMKLKEREEDGQLEDQLLEIYRDALVRLEGA